MEQTEKQMALIFKALSDENRIRILKRLHIGEMCACKLLDELNITQPTLSHHMRILCNAGIVQGRKDGKWMHYSISCAAVNNVRTLMQELLTSETLPSDCECKEG